MFFRTMFSKFLGDAQIGIHVHNMIVGETNTHPVSQQLLMHGS